MTNYNDGKWNGWNGGECPVHPFSMIEVIFTNAHGNLMKYERPAGVHDWNGSGETHAFRVIKEDKEPRVWEVVIDRYGDVIGDNKHFISGELPGYKIIKVKEVLE